MKSTSLWTRKYQTVVDNGRNHSVVLDLPEEKGGINSGATALELCVMGLNGCVTTIFTMVAQKMRIEFEHLELIMDAEQKNDAPTVTDVHFVLEIKTTEKIEKIQKCLETTVSTCPVGMLFKQAGVNITNEIKIV